MNWVSHPLKISTQFLLLYFSMKISISIFGRPQRVAPTAIVIEMRCLFAMTIDDMLLTCAFYLLTYVSTLSAKMTMRCVLT